MTGLHKKKLLVEGDSDKRVIPVLIEANGIPWGEKKVWLRSGKLRRTVSGS
ncbi:MAG: hypothetical protein AB4352_26095 [Hormoscilla sp.]